MLDPELTKHLGKIEKEITLLRQEMTGYSYSFIRGLFSGAGYIIGAALILTIIGWILNIIGVIPAFTQGVSEFRESIDRIGGTVR